MPLKMTTRSRLLDMYANAKKNYQLASFQKGEYQHLVSPFRSVSGSCWKYIWLIMISVCAGCGGWQIFPSVHSPRWLTQSQYPAPMMYPFHKVIRYSGQMGPQEISIPTSFSKLGQLWNPIIFLRALSIWVLKTYKDEEGTMSLDNLLHCLAVLWEQKVSPYIQTETLWACCLSSFHHEPLWKAWLHLLGDLPVSIGGCCTVLQKPPLLQAEQCSSLSLSSGCSSPDHLSGLHWTCSCLLMYFLYWAI